MREHKGDIDLKQLLSSIESGDIDLEQLLSSIESGDIDLEQLFSSIKSGDIDLEQLFVSADSGNTCAMHSIGILYSKGEIGLEKDESIGDKKINVRSSFLSHSRFDLCLDSRRLLVAVKRMQTWMMRQLLLPSFFCQRKIIIHTSIFTTDGFSLASKGM